ncbi:MAG: DUF3097 domain-containing protein [Candidatus Nanopelagicales bacterium]
MTDRYGRDVLSDDPHKRGRRAPGEVEATRGMVVECADTGFCGAVVGVEKTFEGWAVVLEDRVGARRLFPLLPGGFLLEGQPVTLVLPRGGAGAGGAGAGAGSRADSAARRSASGSILVPDAPARVARDSRIWVEGIHDAELVEKVWGHDLRVEGVVVEPLHGADDLVGALSAFRPGPRRRVGVLLDHLVPGSKESRLAAAATSQFADVEVVGHPFVDVWQAVKPRAAGIAAWPKVPKGQPWKAGVIAALGWKADDREAWERILGSVTGYADLEPALLGRVEQLIDFVTAE